MKLLTKTSSIFLFSSLQAAFAGDVRVNVSGLETQTGQIGCSLHSSSTEFPMGHVGTVQVWVKPSGNTAKCTFSDVPAGTYAVAVAHDLNGNKKTDTNTFGLPKEAWGVSRNARPMLRAPRFAEAAFKVGQAPVSLNVEID